jgi:hypothetical protein
MIYIIHISKSIIYKTALQHARESRFILPTLKYKLA